ncbi:phosphatidylinositol N-acetylglucosaminyltransferase subunit P-like isoform X1 [Anthonomus grandis grandis]|uniref:phosphatidylinositol N-acetylglucosaminyltransferase subunit P-like isoform X1 n=1 Tax=Anthonomus grandis grandis TaxID=2921223 RepID=UPI0021655C64|nr:phosphatidylinositol N-acetylglucosaminyltransferase subunit P-like isoform X1 [Anthonomus grandis grandis]XP_050295072.1 phosphatidylinositol N-acetylglucosaminyltransferase subunit P-like isoform X1 [Anthonomus grandis grandis]
MPEHTPAPTPSRAVYGFVMFLSFRIFFIVYLIWALVPEQYFEFFGIDFLPQRHWAVSIPIYLGTVFVIFGFAIYPGLGLLITPDIDDMKTIMDDVGSKKRKNGPSLNVSPTEGECACKNKDDCWKEYYDLRSDVSHKRIPAVKDLCMWEVSEHLYL